MYTNTMSLSFNTWIILIIHLHGVIYADITSSPGVQRQEQGGQAALTWGVTSVTPATDSIKIYRTDPDNPNYLVVQSVYGITSYGSGYNSVKSPIVINEGSDTITVTITSITTNDADQYFLNYQPLGQRLQRNGNAFIYVYGKPTKPILSQDPVTVVEDQDVTVTCTTSHTSVPTNLQQPLQFTWYLDSTDITSSPPARHSINNYTLTVTGVLRTDAANRYSCVAYEAGGLSSDDSNQLQLNVRYAPGTAVLQGAPDGSVIEGQDTLSVTCTLSVAGNPAPHTYYWSVNNTNIDTTTTISLIVTSLTVKQHDGQWRCSAQNTEGQGQNSPSVRITVNAQPTIHGDMPPTDPILITDSLSTSCSFRARPHATVTWVYTGDAGPLPDGVTTSPTYSTVDRVYTVTTSTLTWAVGSTDAQRRASSGTYRCKASNNVGGEVSSGSMVLDVQYGPYEISLTPQGPVTYNETARVTLSCSSDCNPTCDFRWTRANDVNFEETTATLFIDSISRQDDDLYSCQASKHGVQRSGNIDITVNFSAEVADFIHSGTGSDILEGAEITLTCTVNSRPESTLELIDMDQGADLPTCVQCFSLSHTFSSIQVTDSSNYTCTAANILGPDPKARQLLEIDVKGAYETCNSPPAAVGRPLNSNMTMEICLTANPIEVISESDWSFVPDNGTKVDINLPEGVRVVTEITNHKYKKLTKLVIDNILLLHYGRYTLNKANNYGGEQVSINLVPEGPPEVPYDFEVTRITALTIHLSWKAGFDGGQDQSFQLEVTGPQGTFNKDIPGTGYQKDETVLFTLLESDGLMPETSYSVTLIATNSKGSVTGETLSTSTKARPVFTEDNPTIELQTDHALVTWSVSNLDSLTHILAEVCVSADCQTTNITDPAVQPYTVILPQTTSQQYTFSFTFYDGGDVVNQQLTDLDISGSGLSIGAVAGGVIGAVVVVGAVAAVIVLWRRGILPVPDKKPSKKQSSTAAPQDPIVHYENVDGNSPVYHEVAKSNMDISTYQGLHNPVSNMATSTYEELAVSNVKVFTASSSTVIGIFNESSVFRVAMAKPSKTHLKSLPKKFVVKSVVDMVNYPNHYKYLQSAAEVMVKLVNCDNVIHCLGLTTGNSQLLLEHVPNGTLRQYLTGITDNTYINSKKDQQQELVTFIHGAVNGFTAVAELQALFHCLSVDNVLLGTNKTIKLSGFAFADHVKAREVEEVDMKLPRPLRWLAPEAIDLRHCTQSDVWGFGVLMWEILSLGKFPYDGIEDSQVRVHIASGEKLKQPPLCSDDMFDLMSRCWLKKAENRPSPLEVKTVLLESTTYQNV